MSVGIGIIGCGYWGKNYVRIFQEIPDSRVVQVSDLRPESLATIQQYHPGVAVTQDYRDIVNNPDIDAVVIATPATEHHCVTKECLEAGKHVLVEKPLAATLEEGEDLVEASFQHNRILMVGHTFLYNSGIRKIKECIDSQSIGKIYYLHATRTNLGPIRQDVNALWDLAPHDVSIFNYLLNSLPIAVNATGARFLGNDRDDVAFVTLAYPDNIVGLIHVSWVDPNKVRQLTVVGSQQRVVFDDLSSIDRVRIFDKGIRAEKNNNDNFGEFRLNIHDGDIISPKIEPKEPLKNMCSHFIECVLEGKAPLTDGQNGLDVLRVMVAMDRSMKQNQDSLHLNYKDIKPTPISKSDLFEKSRAVSVNQEV